MMDKMLVYAVVLLVAALLVLGVLHSTVEEEPAGDYCAVSSDCEGLPHADCEGRWTCEGGRCSWTCEEEGECSEDGDCVISGCSNQVCGPEPVMTTCEWKEEYACLKFTSCRCLGGECKWEETDAYLSCLEGVGGKEVPIPL